VIAVTVARPFCCQALNPGGGFGVVIAEERDEQQRVGISLKDL
jgi:hypothetical protein